MYYDYSLFLYCVRWSRRPSRFVENGAASIFFYRFVWSDVTDQMAYIKYLLSLFPRWQQSPAGISRFSITCGIFKLTVLVVILLARNKMTWRLKKIWHNLFSSPNPQKKNEKGKCHATNPAVLLLFAFIPSSFGWNKRRETTATRRWASESLERGPIEEESIGRNGWGGQRRWKRNRSKRFVITSDCHYRERARCSSREGGLFSFGITCAPTFPRFYQLYCAEQQQRYRESTSATPPAAGYQLCRV